RGRGHRGRRRRRWRGRSPSGGGLETPHLVGDLAQEPVDRAALVAPHHCGERLVLDLLWRERHHLPPGCEARSVQRALGQGRGRENVERLRHGLEAPLEHEVYEGTRPLTFICL